MQNQTTQFVPAICPQCGAQITVDPSRETAFCPYCGTKYLIDRAINNYNTYVNNTYTTENTTYNVQVGKRGFAQSAFDYMNQRQQRQHEIEMDNRRRQDEAERMRREAEAQRTQRRRKGWATFGKVLLWIYVFPIMLTIYLVKNEKMDKRLKIGLIAALWLLVLAYGYYSRAGSNVGQVSSVANDTPKTTAVTETATPTEKPKTTAVPSPTSAPITELTAGPFNVKTRMEQVGNVRYEVPGEWLRTSQKKEDWIYYYPNWEESDVVVSFTYDLLTEDVDLNSLTDAELYEVGDLYASKILSESSFSNGRTEHATINQKPVSIVYSDFETEDGLRDVTIYLIPIDHGMAVFGVNLEPGYDDPYYEQELAVVSSVNYSEESLEYKSETGLPVYPSGSMSMYLTEVSDLPDDIYTTLGSENGYAGNVYRFEGVVTEIVDKDQSGGVDGVIVTTEDGDVAVFDMYHELLRTMATNEQAFEFFNLYYAEPDADYSLPELGEEAELMCSYTGYSQKLDLPTFYLGANEYLVELLRNQNDESVESVEAEELPDEVMPGNNKEAQLRLKEIDGERVFNEVLDGESVTSSDAYGNDESYWYIASVNDQSVEINTGGKDGAVYGIMLADVEKTEETDLFFKLLNSVFSGDELGAVTTWVEENLGTEASMKAGDANVLLRLSAADYQILIIADDDHVDMF